MNQADRKDTEALERLTKLMNEQGLMPTGDQSNPVVRVKDLQAEEQATVGARLRLLQFD